MKQGLKQLMLTLKKGSLKLMAQAFQNLLLSAAWQIKKRSIRFKINIGIFSGKRYKPQKERVFKTINAVTFLKNA